MLVVVMVVKVGDISCVPCAQKVVCVQKVTCSENNNVGRGGDGGGDWWQFFPSRAFEKQE